MKKCIILSVLIFAVSVVFSQAHTTALNELLNMSLEELMNVEVTSASKISQKASEAPATVYVVTHQQIEARNYSCLKELLDDIPQVEIQRKSISQNTDIFTLNGVSGNEKFLILMDGIRINSTTGTEHTIGESYSLANVKQVEIILGPASSLYGADAFTGIINIITNKGYENKGVHVSSSYGLYNTTDNTLILGAGNKKISFALTGKYYHSDEPFFPDYYSEDYAWYNHYAQTGEMQMFGDTVSPEFGILPWATPTDVYSIHAKLNIKNFEVGYSRLYESHSNSVASLPSTYVYSKETVYANHVQNAYIAHSYKSKNDKFAINSTVSAQDFKVYPHSLFYNQYAGYLNAYKYERDKTIKAEEQFSYFFSDKFVIVGGASYEYINAIPKTSDLPYQFDESKPPGEQNIYYPGTNVIDSAGNDLTIIQDIYNPKYYNIGSYLQVQFKLTKWWSTTIGSRYDYNSRYKSTFNPRLGIVFTPGRFTIKLLYGYAYLAPSPYKSMQHYGSFYTTTNEAGEITGLASGFWHLPNPNLEPEKRVSRDIYMMYQINTNFAVSINGYYSNMYNLVGKGGYEDLEFHGVPIGYVSKTINEGEATAYGGTVRFDYKGIIGKHLNTNLFAAYTYSDGKIADNPLIFSAKHTVKTGICISYKNKFNIYTKLLYRTGSHSRKSTFEEPTMNNPFALITLTANYKVINKQKFKASLFVNVFNLINSKYYNVGYENFTTTPQDPIRIDFGIKLDI